MQVRSTYSAGFTLIELVMSLFILGLVTAAVVWTLPTRGTAALEEANILAAKLGAAQEESIISGETIGVAFTEQSYAFYRYRRGVWIAENDSARLSPRRIDEGVVLSPNGLAAPRDDGPFDDGQTGASPTVFFSPVGVPPIFAVTLTGTSGRSEVRTNREGRIEVDHDTAS
jgi:type II secretion system protein H